MVPGELVTRSNDGIFEIPLSPGDVENDTAEQLAIGNGEVQRLEVLEEEVVVEKRVVTTGKVNIHKQVREHEERIVVPLLKEEVVLERVPVNRAVKTPPPVRQEGDTLIIPVLEERLVVKKQLVLVEEIVVKRHEHIQRQPQTVVLREEVVQIQRDASE